MSIKQGDKVSVGGVVATVESSWGQGAHKAFKLSDGRIVLDLTVASLVTESQAEELKPTRKWDWLPHDGQHDLEE